MTNMKESAEILWKCEGYKPKGQAKVYCDAVYTEEVRSCTKGKRCGTKSVLRGLGEKAGFLVLHGKLYMLVAERLDKLWAEYGDPDVFTMDITFGYPAPELLDRFIVIDCTIIITRIKDGQPIRRLMGSGCMKQGTEKALEKAQTTALGRAIAMHGGDYMGTEIASIDEMLNDGEERGFRNAPRQASNSGSPPGMNKGEVDTEAAELKAAEAETMKRAEAAEKKRQDRLAAMTPEEREALKSTGRQRTFSGG